MAACRHAQIELSEQREDGMHCSGWACTACGQLATGECHHQSWCRADFCGFDPIIVEVRARELIGA
jgi:hypothetical protein